MAKFKFRFLHLVAILFVVVIAVGLYVRKTEGFDMQKSKLSTMKNVNYDTQLEMNDKALSRAENRKDTSTIKTLMETRIQTILPNLKEYKEPPSKVKTFCDNNKQDLSNIGCTTEEVKQAKLDDSKKRKEVMAAKSSSRTTAKSKKK